MSEYPAEYQGWTLMLTHEKTCLGPDTCVAIATRDGQYCTAIASDADSAFTMIQDMVNKRNALTQSSAPPVDS